MKDFTGYEEVVERMARARFDARDHGPRQSNDALEAAMVLAMILEYSNWASEQQPPETGTPPPDPEEPTDPPPEDTRAGHDDTGPAPHRARRGR